MAGGNPNEASASSSSVPTKRLASDVLADALRRMRLHTDTASSSGPTPSTTAGQRPGHPKCLYYQLCEDQVQCSGNKQSRIVRH
eukprot:1237480-Pyramimonas_sp.AAC.1